MIAPGRLRAGDKVALVAPGRRAEAAQIEALSAVLQRRGLTPVPSAQLQEMVVSGDGRPGQLAGTDAARAAAFNAAVRDPAVKAIFFPRAGTGSYRILDKIDYAAVRANPKIIMGFSDVDLLLAAVAARSGVVTFRGPLGWNFTRADRDPRTEEDCFALLEGRKTAWRWEGAQGLTAGTAEGVLAGGNLAVLNAAIGTPFDVAMRDSIVVIEECDELLFRFDRFLYQASAAGKFAGARAVLVGTLENMLDGEQHDGSGAPFGMNLPEMLRDYVPASVPLAMGLPLGHGRYLSSHPVGVRARVTVEAGAVSMALLEPAVA